MLLLLSTCTAQVPQVPLQLNDGLEIPAYDASEDIVENKCKNLITNEAVRLKNPFFWSEYTLLDLKTYLLSREIDW
ncbi:MAG: hypothetical protein IKS44_06910, partial [Bacteroidales bacterium]|nr:hypothetical protein [Bacteroidales bacterium]